jgi:hypothetical protein
MNFFKSLRDIVVGFVIGIFVASFMIISGDLLRKPVERQLIDDWRKIRPGNLVTEVQTILGEPNGRFPLGDSFPKWAEQSVPKDFYKSHGLVTYVIMGIGPQVLLIYFDEQNRVVFVSSTST